MLCIFTRSTKVIPREDSNFFLIWWNWNKKFSVWRQTFPKAQTQKLINENFLIEEFPKARRGLGRPHPTLYYHSIFTFSLPLSLPIRRASRVHGSQNSSTIHFYWYRIHLKDFYKMSNFFSLFMDWVWRRKYCSDF